MVIRLQLQLLHLLCKTNDRQLQEGPGQSEEGTGSYSDLRGPLAGQGGLAGKYERPG